MNTKMIPQESPSFKDDHCLIRWIEAKAQGNQLLYLLAHADDGIIWGRFDNGQLWTADQVGFTQVNLPPLRLHTLQQCRIFGQQCEVFLWRYDTVWRSRYLSQTWEQPYIQGKNYIAEKQLLWGTPSEQKDGFTLLRDGSQGLKHAVPLTQGIKFDPMKNRDKLVNPVRLLVHHYIEYHPEDGTARIFLSRLVNLLSQA
jgi:CRISPR-associated protein (TIGR03984 family)